MVLNFGLKGKVALITGGSRGIGRATAELFCAEGALTTITYARSKEQADAFVEEMRSKDYDLTAIQADCANKVEVENTISTLIDKHGRIDVLVNNAGITKDQLLLMMSDDDWNSVINTNLNSVYFSTKIALRHMLKKRSGVVINLSSIAGSRPGKGHSNYAASKGGIEAFTKSIAAELGARNIRINAIAPGLIETDMSQFVRDAAGDEIKNQIALRKFGRPEDIANAVAFLASDAAAYITGEILHVDGGIRA